MNYMFPNSILGYWVVNLLMVCPAKYIEEIPTPLYQNPFFSLFECQLEVKNASSHEFEHILKAHPKQKLEVKVYTRAAHINNTPQF